jgi:hypothetical protein
MICVGGFVLVWFTLLISVFNSGHEPKLQVDMSLVPVDGLTTPDIDSSRGVGAVVSVIDAKRNLRLVNYDQTKRLPLPQRYELDEITIPPPPLSEIERNMTLYLTTLHQRLGAVAGPTATGLQAWETFLEVTKAMPMVWDEQNKYRYPKARDDNSIFVSLGTYRDPYCPMTIKSLYANAKYPEKVFVGLFQQNCFGPKCRTGVLVGGRVEDAGPDPDCYVEFCKSEEGINSNACHNGNIRLFNVNESESLGPYMARYLGGTCPRATN